MLGQGCKRPTSLLDTWGFHPSFKYRPNHPPRLSYTLARDPVGSTFKKSGNPIIFLLLHTSTLSKPPSPLTRQSPEAPLYFSCIHLPSMYLFTPQRCPCVSVKTCHHLAQNPPMAPFSSKQKPNDYADDNICPPGHLPDSSPVAFLIVYTTLPSISQTHEAHS